MTIRLDGQKFSINKPYFIYSPQYRCSPYRFALIYHLMILSKLFFIIKITFAYAKRSLTCYEPKTVIA